MPKPREQGFFEPEQKEFQLHTMADYFHYIGNLRTRIQAYAGAVHLTTEQKYLVSDAEKALELDGASKDMLQGLYAAYILSGNELKQYEAAARGEIPLPEDIETKVKDIFSRMYTTGAVPEKIDQPLPPDMQTRLSDQLHQIDSTLRRISEFLCDDSNSIGIKGKLMNPGLKELQERSKIYTIDFDNSHFGEQQKPTDTNVVVGELNEWWDKICKENKKDPREACWEDIGYYMIELGKNVLEHGEGGRVEVILTKNKITVMARDQGQGFENPITTIEKSRRRGLKSIVEWADEFIIETNGNKFVMRSKDRELIRKGTTDVKTGSKITFTKDIDESQ